MKEIVESSTMSVKNGVNDDEVITDIVQNEVAKASDGLALGNKVKSQEGKSSTLNRLKKKDRQLSSSTGLVGGMGK